MRDQPFPDVAEFIIGPARWQAPAGPGGSIRLRDTDHLELTSY
jgi:hypothetical protein